MRRSAPHAVPSIANSVDPEYLVIEPTGVAFLSNVINNISRIEYERIRILQPVTLVDFHSFGRFAAEYPELYKDQVANAGLVLATKTEQAGKEEKELLKRELKKLNGRAEIITDHYSTFGREKWKGLLQKSFKGETLAPPPETKPLPDTFTLTGVGMESPAHLIIMLDGIIRGEYGNIFRTKGQLQCGGQKLRFDVADGRYLVTGAEADLSDKAVFIGGGIKRQRLRRYFFGTDKDMQKTKMRPL